MSRLFSSLYLSGNINRSPCTNEQKQEGFSFIDRPQNPDAADRESPEGIHEVNGENKPFTQGFPEIVTNGTC
jgi:hypothetical protein